MIRTIRASFSKRTFNAIIWATIIAVGVVTGFLRRASRVGGEATVAEVDGYQITGQEYRRKVRQHEQYENYLRRFLGAQATGLLGDPKERALKQLMQEKLLLKVSDKLGLELSPDYVTQRLAEPYFMSEIMGDWVPTAALSARGVNYRDLLKHLQRQGVSASCFETILENRLKEQLVTTLASAAGYVPEAALMEAFDKLYRGKKFLIIKIPLAGYVTKAQEKKVTPEALQKLYQEANQRTHRYWSPEKRTGSLWRFTSNEKDFLAQAQHAAAASQAGFDEFVKKHNGVIQALGPVTAENGGQARRLFMLQKGERTAFADTESGQAKKPGDPQAKQHVSVMQLNSIEPSVEQPFEKVKAEVEKDYYRSQAAHELSGDLNALKISDKKKQASWVAEHKAKEITSEFVAPDAESGPALKELKDAGLKEHDIRSVVTMGSVGDTKTVLTPDAGFFIEVIGLEPFNKKLFDEKRKGLWHELISEEAARTARSFVASLEKSGKIKVNKSLGHR